MKRKTIKKKIYKYTAIFELNEIRGYTVTVPALPGLVTEGRSLKEAKKMAEDAIRCYIEGLLKEKEPLPIEGRILRDKIAVAF